MFLSKYGVARVIEIPVIKRAVVDFAVGADWTPAAGDVKIIKDGGAAANVTNLPTAIASGNGAVWSFSLTATEMQAARVVVTVADAATKAVEDQSFIVETYGNASAQHAVDLSDSVRAGLTALPNAAANANGGLPILSSSGTTLGYTITTLTTYTGNTPQTGDSYPKVDTEVATLVTGVADIQARLPAALTANGNLKADALRVGGSVQTGGDIVGLIGTPNDGTVSLDIADLRQVADNISGGLSQLDGRIPAALSPNGTMESDVVDWKGASAPAMTGDAYARWTTAMTESYNADGAAPTPAQALFVIMQMLTEMSIAGTVMTVKKLNGSTTAFTLTLNDATTPTSVTRAT